MREESAPEAKKKMMLYAAIAFLILLLALVSFLIIPQAGSIQGCNSYVFQSSKNACLTSLALARLNATICGLEQGTTDSCYMQLAQKTNSSAICNRMQNKSSAGLCAISIAEAQVNYKGCYNATEPYTSACLDTIGVKLGRASLCTGISNATLKQICFSIINIKQAASLNSPKYCRNATNSTDAGLTNYIIANLTYGPGAIAQFKNNTAASSLLFIPNVNYTARDFCYLNSAALNSNAGLCTNVSAGQARSLCTYESTVSTNTTANYTTSLANCAKAGSYSQQCTYAVMVGQAVKTKNVSICRQLAGTPGVQCYSLIANTYMNTTYCNYITNASQKSACVSNS